jgi:8-oxo-dGTP pyrophosphatase MutT (NUDIX family)
MNQKKTIRKPTIPRPPRAVREFTAGGLVFRRRPGESVDILLIQDRAGRWTIPKGHVEPNESLEETAIREIHEETGLRYLKIRDKLDKTYFFYRKEGKLIFMTLYVFLIEATESTNQLVPENNEGIADVKWFDEQKALKLIEYRNIEKLFYVGLSRLKLREDNE